MSNEGIEVGFFGGSFDPPHAGHRKLGLAVAQAFPALRLLIVPASSHPFGKVMAPFRHRLAMCRLLSALIPGSDASGIEDEIRGSGRTLDTLAEIKRRNPTWRLRLVVGQDVYAERGLWYRFDDVAALAPLIVVGRPGAPDVTVPLLAPVSDASSTEVRQRLVRGEDASGLVPETILAYIREHRLYPQGG